MCALAARLTLSRSPTPADRVLPLSLRHKGKPHAAVIRPLRIPNAEDRSMVAATAAGGLERDVSPGLLNRRCRLPVCVTDVLHTGDPPSSTRAGDWLRLRAPTASDIVGTAAARAVYSDSGALGRRNGSPGRVYGCLRGTLLASRGAFVAAAMWATGSAGKIAARLPRGHPCQGTENTRIASCEGAK